MSLTPNHPPPIPHQHRPQQTDLDRVLSPAQAGKAFDQAVGIMEQVANRLTNHNDLSLETQRLQQDILTMLDQVIESASKGNSKGGGSSSKKQSANQEQPDQQSQQSDSKGKPGDSPSNQSGEAMPGAGADAQPNAQTAPRRRNLGRTPPTHPRSHSPKESPIDTQSSTAKRPKNITNHSPRINDETLHHNPHRALHPRRLAHHRRR